MMDDLHQTPKGFKGKFSQTCNTHSLIEPRLTSQRNFHAKINDPLDFFSPERIFHFGYVCIDLMFSRLFIENVGTSAPRITSQHIPELTAKRGADIHMSCAAEGNPSPTVMWVILLCKNTVISKSMFYELKMLSNIKRLKPSTQTTFESDGPRSRSNSQKIQKGLQFLWPELFEHVLFSSSLSSEHTESFLSPSRNFPTPARIFHTGEKSIPAPFRRPLASY